MKFLPGFMIAVFLALNAARSSAYQREDHYYTVRMALGVDQPRIDGDAVVAVCAQLADEAPELNAVDVYRRLMEHPLDYGGWVLRSKGPVGTVGRMVTVQQILHGLTGGSPEGVRTVAQNSIRDILGELRSGPGDGKQRRADALCALGFAFHLYGDSFAHQMIHNPDKMYKTGIGHLFDLSMPDLPLYSKRRLDLWKRYVASVPDLVPHATSTALEPFLSDAEAPQRSARERNGYNQAALRKLMDDRIRTAGAEKSFVPFDRGARKEGCQALLDKQSAAYGIDAAPNCERAWKIFSGFSIQEYEDYDQDPRHVRKSRDPAYLKVPYLKESLFSKGPNW